MTMDKRRSLGPSQLRKGGGPVGLGWGSGICIFNKLPKVILMWLVVQCTWRKVAQDNVRKRKRGLATCLLKADVPLSATALAEQSF